MSLKNVFVMPSSKSRLKPFGIRVGHAYPIPPPVGMHMVSLESYVDGSTMILNICVSSPDAEEQRAFHQNIHLALYEGADMRGSLLLVRITHTPGQLGEILLCPFNPIQQETLWPGTLDGFYTAARVSLLAILTDTCAVPGKVKGIRLLELPTRLRDHLRIQWKDAAAYEDYDDQFRCLMAKKPLNQIWRESKKF